MGSNKIQKRLSTLKEQAEGKDSGRVKFGRVLFLSFLAGVVATVLFGRSELNEDYDKSLVAQTAQLSESTQLALNRLGDTLESEKRSTMEESTELQEWKHELYQHVIERSIWFESVIFGGFAARRYISIANTLADGLLDKAHQPVRVSANEQIEPVDFAGWQLSLQMFLVNSMLRIFFVLFAFWPLWVLAALFGYFVLPVTFRPTRTNDFLGICDRGKGPFYSGIYGPLRSNGSMSATDMSVPSLACPQMVKRAVALSCPHVGILRKFSAFNETNLGLAQVILAYKDYPCFVEEERSTEEETSSFLDAPDSFIAPTAAFGIVTAEHGTIEKSSLEGLRGILEAHKVLQKLFADSDSPDTSVRIDDVLYATERKQLEEESKQLSTTAKILLLSLTPTRARRIATLPPAIVASAYLAIEAGKSLVFKPSGKGFTPISRYPHVQARAVLHSLPAFHQEYNGDRRILIRLAILCSRRHGDFGRAFLPYNMPIASRALRDWLEILYALPNKRADTAHLVELDAHLEELHVNWRNELSERLRQDQRDAASSAEIFRPYPLWKGLPYKSVVLVPLPNLVDVALTGFGKERETRIQNLIELTRESQATLSISARLPGFKRQAMEAARTNLSNEGLTDIAGSGGSGQEMVSKWLIIRRVLTRYNWLSTRVGDFNVPSDGLVQSVLIDRSTGGRPEVLGLDMLVPLRQRRYKEILGTHWERTYYSDAPHLNDIFLSVDSAEFKQTLKQKIEQAGKGLLEPKDDAIPPISFASGS